MEEGNKFSRNIKTPIGRRKLFLQIDPYGK